MMIRKIKSICCRKAVDCPRKYVLLMVIGKGCSFAILRGVHGVILEGGYREISWVVGGDLKRPF